MDIGSILLILSLALLVGLFVSRPFLEGPGAQPRAQEETAQEHAEDHRRSALLAERDRILRSLSDLDFDQALGKVPAEDYPTQRAELVTAGAAVLRQLDELVVAGSSAAPAGLSAEERLEAAVGTVARPAAGDADLEALVASRRRERQGKTAGFCPHCGRPLRSSDRFCPRCGAPAGTPSQPA
ncbi:MAG: zinc ribbon domain-containing protein [Chloroflexi bacterium]|nr:zinc ribbon domain-containing protein [Chloroflexota bacterium]